MKNELSKRVEFKMNESHTIIQTMAHCTYVLSVSFIAYIPPLELYRLSFKLYLNSWVKF